jgi:hypothetical protein
MDFKFSKHALARMKDREITREQVTRTITQYDSVKEQNNSII